MREEGVGGSSPLCCRRYVGRRGGHLLWPESRPHTGHTGRRKPAAVVSTGAGPSQYHTVPPRLSPARHQNRKHTRVIPGTRRAANEPTPLGTQARQSRQATVPHLPQCPTWPLAGPGSTQAEAFSAPTRSKQRRSLCRFARVTWTITDRCQNSGADITWNSARNRSGLRSWCSHPDPRAPSPLTAPLDNRACQDVNGCNTDHPSKAVQKWSGSP
jgi:hypothetical protein